MKTATLEDVEMVVAERLADLERRIAPGVLTVRDVAARLRLSVTRVRELIGSGELPSYKIGGARRVDPSALAAFLAERQRAGAPKQAAIKMQAAHDSNWLAEFQAEAYRA